MNDRANITPVLPSVAELKSKFKELTSLTNVSRQLSISSITLLTSLCNNPEFFFNYVTQLTPEEVVACAQAMHALLACQREKLLRNKENTDHEFARIPNSRLIPSDVPATILGSYQELENLKKWYTTEIELQTIKKNLVSAIQQATITYINDIQKISFIGKSPDKLLAIVSERYGQLCLVTIQRAEQTVNADIHPDLAANPDKALDIINSILDKLVLSKKSYDKNARLDLIDALTKNGIQVENNQITTTYSKFPFNARLQQLVAQCQQIHELNKHLQAGLTHLNNFIVFYHQTLSIVIDALKYRRDRTRSKPHMGFFKPRFVNAKLCASRADLLHAFIQSLELLHAQTPEQLHHILNQLYQENRSNKLPRRLVDKRGGLDKLLKKHLEDSEDFSMFNAPSHDYRKQHGKI